MTCSHINGAIVCETPDFKPGDLPPEGYLDSDVVKVAIVGRPNVGKSTMINALLGEERVIAFDQPGTTRDAIEVDFERGGRRYTLIDTAGLRRRGKVFEAIETNNLNAGGGYITRGAEQLVVRGVGQVQSLDQIRSIVLTSRNGVPRSTARSCENALKP